MNLIVLVRAVGHRADAVLAGIKSQAFRKVCDVGTRDRSTETFYWREDLLVQVIVYVWLEFRSQDFVDWESVLGRCFGGTVARSRNDEGHYIFGFDVFAFGYQAQSNLDGRHAICVWVFFGIFA